MTLDLHILFLCSTIIFLVEQGAYLRQVLVSIGCPGDEVGFTRPQRDIVERKAFLSHAAIDQRSELSVADRQAFLEVLRGTTVMQNQLVRGHRFLLLAGCETKHSDQGEKDNFVFHAYKYIWYNGANIQIFLNKSNFSALFHTIFSLLSALFWPLYKK